MSTDNDNQREYEASRRQQAQAEEGQEFARIFSQFVNDMRNEPKKAALAAMLRDHRTIQQNMMRFVMLFIEGMAEQECDLRNEASVALAKEIMAIDPSVRALPKV